MKALILAISLLIPGSFYGVASAQPTLEGIKNILEPLAGTDPKAKAARPEDFVNMRFVKELDESGFIDDLYKNMKR
jgi:hypothetical protein